MSERPAISGSPTRDFPYYDGEPIGLSAPQWWLVMAATLLAFLVLIAPVPAFHGGVGQLVPAILFVTIPLFALARVAGRHWRALFRGIRFRDVGWMVLFGLLNLVTSLGVGFVVLKLFGAQPNKAIAGLADKSVGERVLFFAKTLPQLVGEEVLTILPFLALLTLFYGRGRRSRRVAIVGAWLGSAILFGMAHLPTYGWNWVQCLVVIGIARLCLTLPYLLTKNLWVSAGAHIVNDWAMFGGTLLGAALGAGG